MSEIIDYSHVTCGLVPALVERLRASTDERVVFRIRSGMKAEILSGFGTGGDWDLVFTHGVGHDDVVFTRRNTGGDARLRLLDY